MPHLQKYTQAQVALIMAHDLRAKDTSFKSADPKLEKNNIYYLYNGERLEKVRALNKKLLQVAYKRQKYLFDNLPHAKRKDLVTLGEWVITCPRSIPKKDRIKFLQASVDFLCDRYGAKNITCISLHLDEPNSMPHLHATFVPVDSRGKICARNVLTRRELQHFHPDLERYTSQKLGYEVHILKDEDERTKESIPLSQFKVETKAKELEQKEKQIEQQAQEAVDKLETAENAISAAHLDAVEKAAAIMENYDKKGAFKRWFSDPRPFVRDMALELQKAAALEQAAVDQRDKELDEREEAVQQKEQELQRKQKELAQQEQELQQRLTDADRTYKRAEEKERAADKLEKEAADERKDAAKFRAEGVVAKETASKQYVDAKILSDDTKAAINKWYEDKKQWISIEKANERYQDEKKRGDIYEQSSNNYYKRLKEEKARADTAEQTVKRQKEEIADYAVKVMDKDNQIDGLQQKLEKEQEKSGSLETALADNIEYATMLRAELRHKNGLLPVLQTDVKAKMKAYEEQTDMARQKTGFASKLETIEPSPERVAEIKAKLLAKGIHRSNGKKPNGPAGGR